MCIGLCNLYILFISMYLYRMSFKNCLNLFFPIVWECCAIKMVMLRMNMMFFSFRTTSPEPQLLSVLLIAMTLVQT